MTRFLFFDTETTGLPVKQGRHFSEVDNWPRLVQLAFLLFDANEKLISSGNYIIKPQGFEIPYDVSKIHGITTELALAKGVPLNKAICDFSCAVINSDYIVAHNMDFDFNIVGAEATRLGIEKHFSAIFEFRDRICTRKTTLDLCKIPSTHNGYKMPKLTELHKHLFSSAFANPHNALVDAKACAKCFFELKKQGFYSIDCLV